MFEQMLSFIRGHTHPDAVDTIYCKSQIVCWSSHLNRDAFYDDDEKCDEEIEITDSFSVSLSLFPLYQSSVIVGYVQSDDCRCISYIRFLFVYSFLFVLVCISLLVVSKTSNARIIVHFIRIDTVRLCVFEWKRNRVSDGTCTGEHVEHSCYRLHLFPGMLVMTFYLNVRNETQNSKPCQCSWNWPIRMK